MSQLLLRNISFILRSQMARYLVTDSKYRFLKQLGITVENPGLYDGKWSGSGKVRDVDLTLSISIHIYKKLVNNVKTGIFHMLHYIVES